MNRLAVSIGAIVLLGGNILLSTSAGRAEPLALAAATSTVSSTLPPTPTATPTPPPIKSDKYLKDTSWISSNGTCTAPCFHAITPGKTTFADALVKIKADKAFSNLKSTTNPPQAGWSTAGGEACCQMTANDAGFVDALIAKVAPGVTLGQVIARFGQPQFAYTVDYSTTEVAVAVIFPKTGLVVWVSPGDADSKVTASSPVVIVLFIDPARWNDVLTTATLQGWAGYQAYRTYRDATPVVTPVLSSTPFTFVPPGGEIIPSTASQAAIDRANAKSGSPCIGVQPVAGEKIQPNPNGKWTAPDQVIDVTHTYCAIFTTANGRMVAELFPQIAPQNVNNFVFLAKHGFYENITWHRVIQGFMAQSGDPSGTGAGGPGYGNIPLEMNPDVKYDREGRIGVARTSDPNSAGSQFFITFAPQPFLDPGQNGPGYTIIGQVVEGLDVLEKIKIRNVDQNPNLPKGDVLISVRIVDLGATS